MPSLYITTRQTGSGQRYVVRYRLGGRAYPVAHAGSFHTMKEARARRDLVAGEIAAGPTRPRRCVRCSRTSSRSTPIATGRSTIAKAGSTSATAPAGFRLAPRAPERHLR